MIHEVIAKTLVSSAKQPDPWFGIKYTMNLYRGCQHQCIYCDSRSECYQIENFADVIVKVNAIDLLKKELPRKRRKGTIGTGSMSDPYLPLEATRRLTAQALEVIAEHQFPIHALTKSDLVLRDLEVLRAISRVYAAISFTITTVDDVLGKKIEPGAPLVSRRFAAMAQLAEAGLLTGMLLMPVLPFIEDNPENITALVARAKECGASYILASLGMTLRVLIRVTPKLVESFWTTVARGAARTQGVSLPPIKHFKPGFSRLRAFCGDAEVTPIHPFRLEQRVSENSAIHEGLYVFDPSALGPHCGTVKLVLDSEKEPEKGDTRVVDPSVLQQISQDFAPLAASGGRDGALAVLARREEARATKNIWLVALAMAHAQSGEIAAQRVSTCRCLPAPPGLQSRRAW